MTVRIDIPSENDRFDRLRRISWWDQNRLANARFLVIGAGALGNEIIKNLALLGVGNVAIVDMDRVEMSNLTRSVLFREADEGKSKAQAAADGATRIWPGINAIPLEANALGQIGLGWFRWADVVIGGLDNRECRLFVNRACYRLGVPWVDGAIEQLDGVARVFDPNAKDDACYECTLGEADWNLLAQRRACNQLTRSQLNTGHTPTTPTVGSIIAGLQVQEAVKLLHGLETMAGGGLRLAGLVSDFMPIRYGRRKDCLSHDRVREVIPLNASAEQMTVRQLVAQTGPVRLSRPIVSGWKSAAGELTLCFKPLAMLSERDAFTDGQEHEPQIVERLDGSEAFADHTLAQLGLPAWDMVFTDAGVAYELSGDATGDADEGLDLL